MIMNTKVNFQEEKRFLLGALPDLTVVFPSSLIAEIIIIERSKILNLPFYEQTVLGCVHHNGKIIPLISLEDMLQNSKKSRIKERLTVVYLNEKIKKIAGIGLVIERILGSKIASELPQELFADDGDSTQLKMRLFRADILPSQLWQPRTLFSNFKLTGTFTKSVKEVSF